MVNASGIASLVVALILIMSCAEGMEWVLASKAIEAAKNTWNAGNHQLRANADAAKTAFTQWTGRATPNQWQEHQQPAVPQAILENVRSAHRPIPSDPPSDQLAVARRGSSSPPGLHRWTPTELDGTVEANYQHKQTFRGDPKSNFAEQYVELMRLAEAAAGGPEREREEGMRMKGEDTRNTR